jgi:hypothetical protein
MASSCLPPGLFHVADALVLVSMQVGRFAPTLCTVAPTGMAASAHHARSHNVQRSLLLLAWGTASLQSA